ncbi:hypothetical protein Tco_0923968 [Tanacetum coccineum]|uniref:Zinc finger, CCHC-type n=1 Tax=Tanacetum coccineum TaxID=301880 RepID=A0ABQ5D9K7_9ASTR
MAANQTTNNNSIRSILDKEKLNSSNFLDWYRNLRIVLRNEHKLHHLEEALPKAPPAVLQICCCLAPCLAMPIVLFIQNYNMHGMGKTIPELHALLKLTEKGVPKKSLAILAIRKAIEAIGSFNLILPSGMNHLISQEASGSTLDFDEIQRQDAQPSENTSEHQPKVEHEYVKTQTDVIPVRRSAWIPQPPERYGFYVDDEEHELGGHGEPANYQAALSDPEFGKWLEAMNAEMQSMKDN